jgi:neopullulanase
MNYRLGWSSLCWAAAGRLDQTYVNPHYPLEPLETDALLSIWHDCMNTGCLEVNRAQLNLLDSHDVPRALHTLQGDTNALALALVLVVFQLGAPCLYYGTEVGLQGGAEPGCRQAMPWDQPLPQPLHGTIRSLLALRSRLPELRQCGLRWQSLGRDGLMGQGPGLCVVLNRSRRQPLDLAAALPMGQDINRGLSDTLLVGAPETSPLHLAPQSAVLFSRPAA